MSLRSYLFALIGGLIVIFTTTQLLLLSWLEQNIESDVKNTVKVIHERAFDRALERINISGEQPIIIKNKSYRTSTNKNKPHIVIDENIEVLAFSPKIPQTVNQDDEAQEIAQAINNDQQDTHAEEHQEVEHKISEKLLKQAFTAQVNALLRESNREEPSNNKSTFIVKNDNNAQIHQWVRQIPNEQNKTEKLIESIKYSLIISALIALMFAFWLSIQFNKPLKQLANGFKHIAKGDYKHQVVAQGVKEIRSTIEHFNNTVAKLEQFSQAEKQHKEIAHLAELGEVSRGLAHALRNPIHTIGLSIEQLTDNDLSDEQKQTLIKTIQHKIANIDKSIKALLTLTTTGICRTEQVPILAVVQDIILEYKSSVNKPINFIVDIDSDLQIIGAESEIRSILHTLINNACEASNDNSSVAIKAARNDEQICIEVNDSGNGIAAHIEHQLFQPHVSSKPEGAGMGLYIAQRLISLHYQGKLMLSNINDDEQRVIGCHAKACFGGVHHG